MEPTELYKQLEGSDYFSLLSLGDQKSDYPVNTCFRAKYLVGEVVSFCCLPIYSLGSVMAGQNDHVLFRIRNSLKRSQVSYASAQIAAQIE